LPVAHSKQQPGFQVQQLRYFFVDWFDDLVHRPPNTEQMRQLKELLLEEQQSIAQLITLIERYLDSVSKP
jgi:hypothetical protein